MGKMWNDIVKIRNNTKDEYVKTKANILLSQMNTAGGTFDKK